MVREKQEKKNTGHIKLELKNQGGFITGFLTIFFIYFGSISNIIMFNERGFQIPKSEWTEGFLLIWSYQTYLRTYFIPPLVLFLVCFTLTYREDNPHYGIKNSIWFIPLIVLVSFIWYWIIFGVSNDPFLFQFASWQGYINLMILFAISVGGAISGMRLKMYFTSRTESIEADTLNTSTIY